MESIFVGNQPCVTDEGNLSHLVRIRKLRQSKVELAASRAVFLMNKPELLSTSADWTNLLKDPEIASHLGELLQVYREAAPEQRNQALVEAMRKIKATQSAT